MRTGSAPSLPSRRARGKTERRRAALDLCRGRVLDVGAGSGLHSLVLQRRGLAVTAIDVCPEAVEIISRRGVEDARLAEVLRFEDGPFDTLLMLGHGVGMVETLAGLDRLLERAGELLGPEGRILLDSVDVSRSEEPARGGPSFILVAGALPR